MAVQVKTTILYSLLWPISWGVEKIFTRNYISFRRALFFGYEGTSVDYLTPIVTTNGTNRSAAANNAGTKNTVGIADIGAWMWKGRCAELPQSAVSSFSSTDTKYGVYFGTGSTPATLLDYTLDSPIISGLSISNGATNSWDMIEDNSIAGV